MPKSSTRSSSDLKNLAAGPGELPASVNACLYACRHAWKRSLQSFGDAARGPPGAPEAPHGSVGRLARKAFRR
eukprot:7298212-Pyramimonas_sp.AAC.1